MISHSALTISVENVEVSSDHAGTKKSQKFFQIAIKWGNDNFKDSDRKQNSPESEKRLQENNFMK